MNSAQLPETRTGSAVSLSAVVDSSCALPRRLRRPGEVRP